MLGLDKHTSYKTVCGVIRDVRLIPPRHLSNSGPRAPEARIIPLDQSPVLVTSSIAEPKSPVEVLSDSASIFGDTAVRAPLLKLGTTGNAMRIQINLFCGHRAARVVVVPDTQRPHFILTPGTRREGSDEASRLRLGPVAIRGSEQGGRVRRQKSMLLTILET